VILFGMFHSNLGKAAALEEEEGGEKSRVTIVAPLAYL